MTKIGYKQPPEVRAAHSKIMLGNQYALGKHWKMPEWQKKQLSKTRLIDISGQKFNFLTVLKFHHKNARRQSYWECVCDCGNKKVVNGKCLKMGETKSCGCKSSLATIQRNKDSAKHNLSRSRFYHIWANMIARCFDPKQDAYQYYGAKGITVCDSWKEFIPFRDDMYKDYLKHAKKYGEDNTSIDRINNKGNYFPANCRWATRIVQANNKGNSRFLTYKNQTMTLAQWANKLGVDPSVIYSRIKFGWTMEEIISTPKIKRVLKPSKPQIS